MRMALSFTLGLICLNLGILVCQHYNLVPGASTITPFNMGQVTSQLNQTQGIAQGISTGNPALVTLFYLPQALAGFINLMATVLVGFPLLLQSYGVDQFMAGVLMVPYLFIYGVFLLDIIRGSDSGD